MRAPDSHGRALGRTESGGLGFGLKEFQIQA